MITRTTTSLLPRSTIRVVPHAMRHVSTSLFVKQKPTYKLGSITLRFVFSKRAFSVIQSKRPVICKSLPDSMIQLDAFIKDRNLMLVSHAIVIFSAIYCSLNWLYYRRMREKMEEDDKNKK